MCLDPVGEWHLNGGENTAWPSAPTRLVFITDDTEALEAFELVQVGSLFTLYKSENDWADYRVVNAPVISGERVTFPAPTILPDSQGSAGFSSGDSIMLHFRPKGERGEPGISAPSLLYDKIGQPGIAGGYTLLVPDTIPDFGSVSVPAQIYEMNISIPPLQLPEAAGGNSPVVYTLSPALPPGLIFDASTRQIVGTPSAGQAATTYTYRATDNDGDTDSLTFRLTVRDPMPTFGSAAVGNQVYAINTAISPLQLPEATDGNAPLTYSLTPALPLGLTFNAGTRRITGTPTQIRSVTTYTYLVTDDDGDTDSLTFTLRVRDPMRLLAGRPLRTGPMISTRQFRPCNCRWRQMAMRR